MASRQEYIDKLEEQLREWNARIDSLQKRANKESQDLKARLEEQMNELKEQRRELKIKLNKIKDSSDDVFDDIREDTERLWTDVKKGFSEMSRILSE